MKWFWFVFVFVFALCFNVFILLFTFNWRIITLQCCDSFCCVTTWIRYKYTYISSLLRLPPAHPHPTPLGHHRAPNWVPCIMEQLPSRYFTHGSEYMSMLFFPFVPLFPSPTCPQVRSLNEGNLFSISKRFEQKFIHDPKFQSSIF